MRVFDRRLFCAKLCFVGSPVACVERRGVVRAVDGAHSSLQCTNLKGLDLQVPQGLKASSALPANGHDFVGMRWRLMVPKQPITY